MGIFTRRRGEPHPRKEPLFDGPLTADNAAAAFGGSADLLRRRVRLGGDPKKEGEVLWVAGMVRTERANDYVLRPLTQDRRLTALPTKELGPFLLEGGLYDLPVTAVDTLDDGVAALIEGDLLLFLPGTETALRCGAATEEKRAVSDPKNEPAVKGALDSFTESLRTNTSLVRRRLRSPMLRVEEEIIGRQSRTPVDLVYLKDIARAERVADLRKRLAGLDMDGLLTAGDLEQYLAGDLMSPFPQTFSTQRPDRFCANLLCGRVGILADGIPLGFLLPATAGLFFATEQDRTDNWVVAAGLTLLRYAALLITLFLPALYTAAVLFHPEMIPLALAESIIKAEEGVPFGALFEVVMLLVTFEVIQEAGLRLPGNLGQTVSILGGLVVGSAAVEAKIASPAILIVVALAGIAGYTVPSQELTGGIRLWRLIFAVAGGVGGYLGVVLAAAVLLGHLSALERWGVPWLSPFVTSEEGEEDRAIRAPIPRVKDRPGILAGPNRRARR